MDKIPSPKEIRQIVKRLTPEERKRIEAEISEVFAKYKRTQFKLVWGGRSRQQ